MARKNRIWYPGAMYHITGRGNRKADLFEEQSDYRFFLNQISEAKEKFPFTLHALCLMTNHFHFVLETEDVKPGRIMSKILSNYAGYFNYKYSFSGHVFEGRYKSSLIESDAYFLEISRYIHLNPVKANIVRDPLDYEYSSYPLFVSGDRERHRNSIINQMEDIVDTSRILGAFGNDRGRYRMFVEGDPRLEKFNGDSPR